VNSKKIESCEDYMKDEDGVFSVELRNKFYNKFTRSNFWFNFEYVCVFQRRNKSARRN
jgi:myosin-crossreactive antigen